MSKLKLALGILVVVAVTVAYLQLYRAEAGLREENDSLRQQLAQLQTENESLSNQLATAGSSKKSTGEQLIELLKLRGDVRSLQQQVGDVAKLRAEIQRLRAAAREPQPAPAQPNAEALAQQQAAAVAALNRARDGMIGFIMFADQNQQQFPASFDQAAPYLKDALAPVEMNFEIVYVGSLTNITNAADAVVLREKHAAQTLDGQWRKAYGFADGHAEMHTEPDGNFDNWESQHIVPPPANQWPGK